MKLLDLYCGAGGASMGYSRAGFEVTGVDIDPQPNYPFTFIQGDAVEYCLAHGHGFDAIHASPPCQKYSLMSKGRWKNKDHPDLIATTREAILKTGRPYIIENVSGARAELINPFMLCGTMFQLKSDAGNQLYRHRYFESDIIWPLVPPCQHDRFSAVGVYGGGQHPKRKFMPPVGVYGSTGGSSKRDNKKGFGINARRQAMGIDWMTNQELNESIPPAYTQFIGEKLKEILNDQK